MAYNRFITITDVKNITGIHKNIQEDLLEPFIDASQRIYLLRLLGTAQMESLSNAIGSAGSISAVTGNNSTLLTQIKIPLSWATAYESSPFLMVNVSNKGMVYKSSQDSQTISEDRYKEIKGTFFNHMQFELNELRRYLRTHTSTYTLWREEYFNEYEYMSGATRPNNYFSGIVFDDDTTFDNY